MRVTTLIIGLSLLLVASTGSAEVAKVNITNRVTVADGMAFGTVGSYEKLLGSIEFTLDPKEPHNKRIADLDRATVGSDGRVHFTSDLVVLRPTDAAKGNGVLLFEVVNRGRIGILGRLNGARGSDSPMAAADFGNGYLMREGYTLVIVGWEFDLQAPLLHTNAPAAEGVTGPLSVRFILDAKANEADLDDAPLYSPVNPNDAASTMTVRDHYWDAPTPIARNRWRFVTGSQASPRVALDGGFEPGRWYEVTFTAAGARVAGVGMAAIRDAAAAFRYRTDLPVQGKTAYVFGASQDGRFLRQFLFDGFNADERNRRVFDAAWSHIAGAARGSFNERFATPVSGSIFSPTRFPFSVTDESLNGERGSLLMHYTPEQRPKLFFSNTPVEYWGGGRAAALTHISPDGKRDLTIPADVRIYFLAGTQHGEAEFPPSRTRGQQLQNPVPQREVMRALLRGLHEWAGRGTPPPDSRYPKLADGSLTPVAGVKFPAIPGVLNPHVIPGPAQTRNGKNEMLPFLVPQVNADGNELAGIRVPDVAVPMATNTGWNFRAESVGNSTSEVYNNMGSYIPFAATRTERDARKDPRPSIAERYRDEGDYLAKLRATAEELVKGRYLLREDIENVVKRGQAQWQHLVGGASPASR